MSESEYLFVYGTLRRDTKSNMNKLLSQFSQYTGKGTFIGKLFLVGCYPGAIRSKDQRDTVQGDLYKLTNPGLILSIIDKYEGCTDTPSISAEYVREKADIMLNGNGKIIKAWIYLFNKPVNGFIQIDSGNFLKPQRRD